MAASTTRANGCCPACARLRRGRAFGLGGDQRGDGADHGQRGHRVIAPMPGRLPAEAVGLEAAHQKQRACGRDQHADAIGGDVRRHAGGLLVRPAGFRCGRRRRRCPASRKPPRPAAPPRTPRTRHPDRIAQPEQDDGEDQQHLREHQPAAAAAEQARQHRHVERVGQRRPQELDGVRRAGQPEQADDAEIDAGFLQPHRKRGARQRQRQPGREAEEQHDQHARLEIDRGRVEDGGACLLGAGRGAHAIRRLPACASSAPG